MSGRLGLLYHAHMTNLVTARSCMLHINHEVLSQMNEVELAFLQNDAEETVNAAQRLNQKIVDEVARRGTT